MAYETFLEEGIRLLEEGNSSQAIIAFRNATQQNDKDEEAFNHLGSAYIKRWENVFEDKLFEKAIESYTRAIEINPNYAEAYTNRGEAYRKKDKMDEAIMDLTHAIHLKSDYAHAHFYRGIVYMRQGEFTKAESDFNNALICDPDHKEAIKWSAHAHAESRNAEKLKETVAHLRAQADESNKRIRAEMQQKAEEEKEKLKREMEQEFEDAREELEKTIEDVKGFDEVYHELFKKHKEREKELEDGVKFWLWVLFGFLFVSVAALIYWVQFEQIASDPPVLLSWVLLIGFLISPLAWYIRYIRDEKNRAEVLKNYYQHKEHLEMRWKVLPKDSIRPMQERLIEYGMEKSPEETILALNRKGDSGSSPLTPAALAAIIAAVRRAN